MPHVLSIFVVTKSAGGSRKRPWRRPRSMRNMARQVDARGEVSIVAIFAGEIMWPPKLVLEIHHIFDGHSWIMLNPPCFMVKSCKVQLLVGWITLFLLLQSWQTRVAVPWSTSGVGDAHPTISIGDQPLRNAMIVGWSYSINPIGLDHGTMAGQQKLNKHRAFAEYLHSARCGGVRINRGTASHHPS